MEKESLYFKNKNGGIYHAVLDYDEYPENPRNELNMSNLGTMVFKNNRNHTLGDEQTESFEDYFKDQLSHVEPSDYFEGYFEFEIPEPEQIVHDENLSRFIAGNNEIGFHFDKDLYHQEISAVLSGLKEQLGEYCKELDGGIPVDEETQHLTDVYRIDLRTKDCKGYEDAEYCLNMIKSELASALGELAPKNIFNYIQDSIHEYNSLDDLSESQLFDKWASTKLCVIPINVYEHSGITCHSAALRKTLHVPNDRDDGFIYNDGFIYVDKNNSEVLNELKGEARDSEGKVYNTWKPKTPDEVQEWAKKILEDEIKLYASYISGDCTVLRIEEFNKETLQWDEVEGQAGIYGGELCDILKEFGYKDFETISKQDGENLSFTITEEYKKHIYDCFVDDIKKLLPEFDDNIVHAVKAIQYNLKKNYSPDSIHRKALDQFFIDKGCTDGSKTIGLIKESLGIRTSSQEIKPLSFRDKNLDCWYCVNRNQNCSACGAPHAALLVDWKNKRYGYVTGVEDVLNKPSDTYLNRVTKTPSKKSLEGQLKTLVAAGFKNTPVEDMEGYCRNEKWVNEYVLKEPQRGR